MPGQYDDADFTLAHAEKDCRLTLELAAQQSVPMQLAELAHHESTSAINRGWNTRDERASMLLQLERAELAWTIYEPYFSQHGVSRGNLAKQVGQSSEQRGPPRAEEDQPRCDARFSSGVE